ADIAAGGLRGLVRGGSVPEAVGEADERGAVVARDREHVPAHRLAGDGPLRRSHDHPHQSTLKKAVTVVPLPAAVLTSKLWASRFTPSRPRPMPSFDLYLPEKISSRFGIPGPASAATISTPGGLGTHLSST